MNKLYFWKMKTLSEWGRSMQDYDHYANSEMVAVGNIVTLENDKDYLLLDSRRTGEDEYIFMAIEVDQNENPCDDKPHFFGFSKNAEDGSEELTELRYEAFLNGQDKGFLIQLPIASMPTQQTKRDGFWIV